MSNPNLVGIKQLKMMIKTSIPEKDEFIEFTSDLLKIKSKGKPFSKYPFFSETHLYPKIKLQNYTYERVVEFFFNKDVFQKIIRNKTRKNIPNAIIKSPNEIKLENFELTLQLLFPTYFPLVNNIDNSVEYIIPNKKLFTLKGSNTLNALPVRFNPKFSYLTIGPEKYTITKTIWKNDVMNHPVYSEILQIYKQFDNWQSDSSANVFKDSSFEEKNMNNILSYVFDAVQKSNEDPLFKPMYLDADKAPYNRKNTREDENLLSIQEFDNAVNEIMQKNENILKTEKDENKQNYNALFTELDTFVKDPSNIFVLNTYNTIDFYDVKQNFTIKESKLISEAIIYTIENFYDDINSMDVKLLEKEENVLKGILDKINKNQDVDIKNKLATIVDGILDIFYKIMENNREINNSKRQKNKSNSGNDFYIYFSKVLTETEKNTKKNELIAKDYNYKLKLINLLGKLILTKSTHNISPDFLKLISYLKTKIKDFNTNRNINDFIHDLNIKFLSDSKLKDESEKIKNLYVEFYNLALVINDLKGRKIDNNIWKDVVFKMTNGTLQKDEFNKKIWEPIQDCYNLETNDANIDNTNPKKEKSECNSDVINVGFDIIPTKSKDEKESKGTRKANIQTIEIYLQMDLIEGEINESNMDKIKCSYDDEFLGSMFRDLTNTSKQINNFPSQQVFFSAKKLLNESSDNAIIQHNTNVKKKPQNKTKKGGRYLKIHKTKKNIIIF